ncbi:AAA family ATPase [Streptomyces sp. NPDC005876]|uniref:helix-turn-helix transcriptional regulator n=1 Tax=Streptomyces sp. NPDC005876 TaxID=3157076 RepID=UPI003400E699
MTAADQALSRSGLRGREAELERLRALVDSVARTGGGALALIGGEAGIGKTALLGDIAERAGEAGFSVGLGKADELHHLVPLSSLMACLTYGERPLLSDDALAHLSRGHDQRIWLVQHLAERIEARAALAPVLIGLDDVQWADPLSRFVLRQLPARLRTSPVLWLLTRRQGPARAADEILTAAAPALPTVTVRLGPLSDTAIGELAGDVLGGSADARVRELLEGAGGNPFLAVEMLSGLRTGDPARRTVPPGLVVGVRGRLAPLSPGTLGFLQVGAVLGRRFRFQDAAALGGRSPAALVEVLGEAVRAGLLADEGDFLVFRHDLLRQAVYADIPPSARRALHREAARRLIATGHRPIDAVAHLLTGALPGDEEAGLLLSRAAEDVLPVTPALAADLFARALELTPPQRPAGFDVGERAIAALARAGRDREALETGERLLARQPPLEVFGRLQAAIGTALWNLDRAEDLLRRVEAALAAGGAAPETGARLTALRALALSRGADLGAARAAGETALREAIATGDRQAHVQALFGLGETALNAGENTEALKRFAALGAVDPAYLPEEIVAHQHLDDFASGERLLRRAAAQGGTYRQAMLLWAQGQQHLGLGRLDDAESDLVTMERLEDEVEVPVHQVNARVVRSRIGLLRGDRPAARADLAAARERLAVKPNPGNTAVVDYLEALHADAEGERGRAVERLRAVQRHDGFMRWRLLRTWVDEAIRIALRGGDRRLAEDLAAQAVAYAARNPGVPTATGLAAQARGLVRDDIASLRRSAALLQAGPRPLNRAAALTDLGAALLAAGRRTEAVDALTTARALFAESGAHAAAARAQDLLGSTGAHSRRSSGGPRPAQGWAALTASERKVARLIAQGHTNRSAADLLVVSPHTVNTHLSSVFRKLSVNSRVQLAHVVLASDDT